MESKKTTWVAGTVLVGVVIAALAWFVLITPLRDQTATASADADAAEQHNVKLAAQLAVLKQQTAHLPEYKKQRDALRVTLPAQADLTDYLRSLDAIAEDAGVTITDTTANPPTDVVVATPAPTATPTAAASDSKDSDGAKSDADKSREQSDEATKATTSAASSGSKNAGPVEVQIPGFVAMPFDITVVGNPKDVDTFVAKLQQGDPRPFLVIAMTGTGQQQEEATGGHPATKDGDLEMTVSGYVYVLKDAATAVDDAKSDDGSGSLPKWNGSGTPWTGTKG
ncbi:hypothetical protein [Cellulomonas sp. HZM]|uniref:hypothetical protein n=1 Tax=Cellulomonas sp. HZM TaxID=1454010 RepID=UPI000558EA6F|nr:hypothetical protein [Cellulomonas sp. HZM]